LNRKPLSPTGREKLLGKPGEGEHDEQHHDQEMFCALPDAEPSYVSLANLFHAFTC